MAASIRIQLPRLGVDKDTILVYDRTINGKSGGVGSGHVLKNGEVLLTVYVAGFYISPKSLCWIMTNDNETKMISAIKTIKVTETS